jgi:Zn-dependent protease with chaperone function
VDAAAPPDIAVRYFDGRSGKPVAARLTRQNDHLCVIAQGLEVRVPIDQVQWPERVRHGPRVAHFSAGGSVQPDDAAAWDLWLACYGPRESLVVKMQQSWRSVLVSAVLLIATLAAAYGWGLPALSDALVAAVPSSVDRALGESSLVALDAQMMRPSKLSAAQQQRLQQSWQQVTQALPVQQVPPWQLIFRDSQIGPNAFALPGDTMVMTDQLVQLVNGNSEVLVAVLAHELGHLKHRHGMRMLVQAGVLGTVSAVALGDFSGLLGAVPLLLGHAHYSREAERQADAFAVQVLHAAGISPLVMLTLFDKLEQHRKQGGDRPDQESLLGIAFASHPRDAQRIAFFQQAAEQRPRAAGSAKP